MAKISMHKAIQRYLYEQDDNDEEASGDQDDGSTPNEKEQDVQNKNIKDVDKNDLEVDDIEEEDVAISVTLNDNLRGGGKIKFVNFKLLPAMNSIESLLKLFNLSADQNPEPFKNMVQLTIRSPLADFTDEVYEIRLMDGNGEISIQRPELNTTISKKSATMNMQQAVQGQMGGEEETPPANLGYLPELNYEFRQAVKNEFFNRILSKR